MSDNKEEKESGASNYVFQCSQWHTLKYYR